MVAPKIRLLLAASISSMALAIPAVKAFDPKSVSPINLAAEGIAIRGYDPVAYFTANKPMRGETAFQSVHDGAIYRFSSAANKAVFDQSPASYAPQYGGFCAFAAAKGSKFDVDPEVFKVVNNKLYLNFNADVGQKWNADVAGHIKAADANWPVIKDKAPKP